MTVYLEATAADITERTRARHGTDPTAHEPLTDAGLINAIRTGFARPADDDPTGVVINTHGKKPREIAEHVSRLLQVGT